MSKSGNVSDPTTAKDEIVTNGTGLNGAGRFGRVFPPVQTEWGHAEPAWPPKFSLGECAYQDGALPLMNVPVDLVRSDAPVWIEV